VTIYIVLALTVGGTGSMRGAIIGAILVVALTEGTRFVGGALPFLRPVQVAALREGMIGMMLIAVLMVRPEGLLPERLRRYERKIP
jgi:branched-chain amino acid transport system permease protein